MKIALPIIVEEPGTLIVYNSIADAEHQLEIYDVNDALYRGWDAEGRLLEISCNNDEVVINTHDAEPDLANINTLEQVLRDHLSEVGISTENISNRDLPSLIKEANFFVYIPKSKKEVIKDFLYDLFSAFKKK